MATVGVRGLNELLDWVLRAISAGEIWQVNWSNLLEVDALAAGVGAGKQLHSTAVQSTDCVVGYERTTAQLLQRMSTMI